MTVLLGIAGALIGYWVWGLLGGSNTLVSTGSGG